MGAELDVEGVDVFVGGEFGWGFYGVALDADVETAEVGDDDFFAVQEVVAHHFAQFGEHEDDVGGFGGAVARDFFGELCKSYAAGLAGAGVVAVVGPLLFKGTYYCHIFFIFQCRFSVSQYHFLQAVDYLAFVGDTALSFQFHFCHHDNGQKFT